MRNIYFSFTETRNLVIIKLINRFLAKYNYCYYDSDLKPSVKELKKLRGLDHQLKIYQEDERQKDKETIMYLKNNLSKDFLLCLRNDFCYAKEKQDKNLEGFSEIFSVILVSLLIIVPILFIPIPQLKKILETQAYNGIFGSSILVFLALPIFKYLLNRTSPPIEIYSKCISLLDRAIN